MGINAQQGDLGCCPILSEYKFLWKVTQILFFSCEVQLRAFLFAASWLKGRLDKLQHSSVVLLFTHQKCYLYKATGAQPVASLLLKVKYLSVKKLLTHFVHYIYGHLVSLVMYIICR